MRRGEIYFAALDPTVGANAQKTRPVVVVGNNAGATGDITLQGSGEELLSSQAVRDAYLGSARKKAHSAISPG